jgi:AraC family transcriptional regulator
MILPRLDRERDRQLRSTDDERQSQLVNSAVVAQSRVVIQALRAQGAAQGARPRVCFGTGIRLREAGFEIAHLTPELPEMAVEPHVHEDSHFVLVLEGTYVSSAAGAPATARAPLLIYNPAGTMHRDRFRGEGGRFVAFGIPQVVSAQTMGLPDLPVRLGGVAFAAARRAAEASTEPDPDTAGLCWELLAALSPAREARQPHWLSRARTMIGELSDQGVRVCEVAAEVGVHPVHLARAFRAAWGYSPSEYHSYRRTSQARALIAGTRLSLVDVALCTGFGDQSHLTRAFTRRYGIAPGAFRAALGHVAIRQDEEGGPA